MERDSFQRVWERDLLQQILGGRSLKKIERKDQVFVKPKVETHRLSEDERQARRARNRLRAERRSQRPRKAHGRQ